VTDIRLHHRSAKEISEQPLPGPSFVLRMADEESLLATIKDRDNLRIQHSMIFNDADSSYGLVRSPTREVASAVLHWFGIAQEEGIPNFVAQCQAGKGRSQAVIAALCKKLGRDCTPILRNGTYNRKLYKLLMEEIGQPVEFIITPQETRQAVGPSLKEHIRKHGHPDGLFCFNDNMAIGALRALRDLDLRIPQDVALIGCDGIDDSAYLDPSLTTIAQPLEEMCEIAWSFLEARMKNPDLPVQQATLYPTLEIRGSSMK